MDGHKATLNLNSSNNNTIASYLDIIETVNDYRDNIGGSFASSAGLTRLGTNGRIYFPTVGGRVFYGNRYVGTASLAKWGGQISKGAWLVSAGIGVYKTIDGVQKDKGKFGHNAQKAAAGATGSMLGGWGGAEARALMGAEFGGTVGSFFGGVGAIPGGIIGGIVGGVIGAFGGSMFGGAVAEGSVDAYYMP